METQGAAFKDMQEKLDFGLKQRSIVAGPEKCRHETRENSASISTCIFFFGKLYFNFKKTLSSGRDSLWPGKLNLGQQIHCSVIPLPRGLKQN